MLTVSSRTEEERGSDLEDEWSASPGPSALGGHRCVPDTAAAGETTDLLSMAVRTMSLSTKGSSGGDLHYIDRIKLLYPMVNETESPLPRSWSPKDKFNFIGLSQNNLRVHYKGIVLNFNVII